MIIGGSASQNLTAKIAAWLGDEVCPVEIRKFPDGEKYIRIKGRVDEEVVLVQSTGYPQDENLMELLFLISNLKDLGAEQIKVVVPYFGYGRQEKRFKDGETISAKIISNLIENAGATEFISLNLHERSLEDFFSIPAYNLSAMPVIAEYIKENAEDPIIVGPDISALSFATEIANILNCDSAYLSKVRISPNKVETRISNDGDESKIDISSVEGKEVFLVDDIISTGGTIVSATKILKKHGAKSVDACCVHPVLVDDAVLKIYGAGVRSMIGTDTLTSDISHISVASIIANKILGTES